MSLPEPTTELPRARAEVAEVERLIDETGVVTSVPEPGVGAWLQDLFNALGEALTGLLTRHLGTASELAAVLVRWSLGLLLLLLLALAGLYVWRVVKQRRLGQGEEVDSVAEPVVVAPTVARGGWGEALRERLAAGDGLGAAEALWWWLAERLEAPAEPSWTSRELIVRAGRPDLRSFVRRLDRILYDARTPVAAEVETLWLELGEHLG